MKNKLIVYTDGASRGNPGPGGWGAVIIVGGMAMELSGASENATNNQMELAGVLAVLSDTSSRTHDGPVIVYSDSAYVVNGLTTWVWGWEKKGWVTSQKTPVENREVWEKLLMLLKEYSDRLTIEKIKGHAGELYNERCDELAVAAALGTPMRHFKGTLDDYHVFLEEQGTMVKKNSSKKTNDKRYAYSYVSLVEGKVFVDKTWVLCEKRVKGKKAKFKKVFSKEEETALVGEYTLQSLL